jgi:rhamnogalacturonyl hydrolase YesR
MNSSIVLGVYRRLDNRSEGLSDDSPRALELHNLRKDALHAVLDSDPAIQVMDWGATDDPRPHEYVEIALGAAATAVFQYAIVPGVKWLGLKLAEKAVDTALGELAKAIVAKLRPKQEAKQMLDFIITLPDGTQIAVEHAVDSASRRG